MSLQPERYTIQYHKKDGTIEFITRKSCHGPIGIFREYYKEPIKSWKYITDKLTIINDIHEVIEIT
jgi:hypothetical protein